MSVYMQFFDTIGGVRVVRGQKIGQNEHMYDFLALFEHFHIVKMEMNTYAGSSNLQRLLEDYEP